MKKIYKVTTHKTDGMEGKTTRTETEYVRTADIAAYVKAKKDAIETRACWWMDHEKDDDKRPRVTAEEITITEA